MQFERLCREVGRSTGIEVYQFFGARDTLQQWCRSVRHVAYDDWIPGGAA